MIYRILIDGRAEREQREMIYQPELKPYHDKYHFIGTDHGQGFYNYVFLSEKEYRKHQRNPFNRRLKP